MSNIEIFHEASKSLADVRAALESLAAAFEYTGNLIVANELQSFADQIGQARDVMSKSFSAELDRGFKQAQQSSATMLEAVLAGVVVGREAPDAGT